MGSSSFREDGAPMYMNCWIPLVDVPQTSSCLMCVPKSLDDGYAKTRDVSAIAGAHQLDKVQPLTMEAGDACLLSHRLYYWGKIADASREDPCTALVMAIADRAMQLPHLPRHVLPLPPQQLRVALAAGQTLLHGRAVQT